jgi:tight adherence protein C
MTVALLAGALLGLGVMLTVSGFLRQPIILDVGLRRIHAPTVDRRANVFSSWRVRTLGASWQTSGLARRLLLGTEPDLAITNTSAAEHLTQRITFAILGLFWAPATAALIALAGASVPFAVPLWASLFLAPIGFLYPSIYLRSTANARRRSLRHALSSFLDLVSIALSGGRGIDGALSEGAAAGDGWAFEQFRDALLRARLMGTTPWSGLAELGDRLDLPELKELAASAELGGAEGARVRASIAAKARALRLRGLTDVEAAAQSASEKMSLPIVGLMVGFIIFLGYPAVIQVVNGL